MNEQVAREMHAENGSGAGKNSPHAEPLVRVEERTASTSASFVDVWEQLTGPPSASIYPAGVQFLEQGSQNSDVYFIRRGIIKLRSIDRAGRETIVGVRRTGGLVGVEATLLSKPHLVSAVTVTECCLERLPARQFCELIRKNPDLSWRLHQISASEVRETTVAIVELKSHTANIRLKRLVLELVPELKGAATQNAQVRLPFKHWEIAQMLGITPEHLSRLLRRLEKEGFLDRKDAIIITRSSL